MKDNDKQIEKESVSVWSSELHPALVNDEKALQLRQDKVSRLIWKYSLPAIAAMVVSSLYNIIAGIFIGHLGAYNIAGVGLTAPIMNLGAALGSLVGVGGSVLCSISLGEKNYSKARKILGNVVILNFVIGILFTIVGLIWLDPILLFFGASENTLQPAHEYMTIILYGNVFAHSYLGLNNILRVSGSPVAAMNITFLSVVVNIILAPIFIFIMDMGVKGAALATVIAEIFCCVAVFALFVPKSRPIHFERKRFKLDFPIVKQAFKIGLPNFFTNAAACFIVVLQNYNLLEYGGDLHVGALSIINRVGFLFFMIALGFSQGMQPIVAYNFGAKQYDRMWQAFKMALSCALVVTCVGTFFCEFFPREMASFFVDGSSELDTMLLDVTTDGFRLYNCCFWIIATQVIGSNFFASMNQPGKSLFLSLTRQVIFIIPLLFVLPPILGVNGVWLTTPISDVVAALCAMVLLMREWKKQKRAGYV